MDNMIWKELELVIFDVDGTLYKQSSLRKIMLFKLLSYYLIRPWRYKELVILSSFRKEREKRPGFAGPDLQEAQYTWCAESTGYPVQQVKKVINKWIFNAPNPYLKASLYPGIANFFKDLRENGIKIAIYSDYDSENKLKSMELIADFEISSTDKKVNSFKPIPKGLLVVLDEMKITKKANSLFIGDRIELDGVCAENAGIPFLLVDKSTADKDFYTKLSNHLIQSRR